jgi:hypothetical protein
MAKNTGPAFAGIQREYDWPVWPRLQAQGSCRAILEIVSFDRIFPDLPVRMVWQFDKMTYNYEHNAN